MHQPSLHRCGFLAWIDWKPAKRTNLALFGRILSVTHMHLDSSGRALFQFRRGIT